MNKGKTSPAPVMGETGKNASRFHDGQMEFLKRESSKQTLSEGDFCYEELSAFDVGYAELCRERGLDTSGSMFRNHLELIKGRVFSHKKGAMDCLRKVEAGEVELPEPRRSRVDSMKPLIRSEIIRYHKSQVEKWEATLRN